MQVKIVKVSTEWVEKGKNKWQKLNVVFVGEDGKVDGRNLLSFTNKEAFETLKAAQRDEVYELTEIKNDKGYPEVKAAKKIAEAAASTSSNVSDATSSSKGLSSGVSTATRAGNWETAEERAARQVMIVRQSSLSTAQATLAVGAKALKGSDVIGLAMEYEDYVLGKGDPIKELIQMTNDIPPAE